MRITHILSCLPKISKHTLEVSNLPERYVRRTMEKIYWKTPNLPQYQRKVIQRENFKIGLERPWSTESQNENNILDGKFKKLLVEPVFWRWYKGDRVEILVGKDKGKQGIINYIVQENNWVTVEGLNCKNTKMNESKNFPGIVYKKEMPLLVTSEIALVDPSDNKSTDVEWRFSEKGEKVRVSIRTGRIIPIPAMAFETYDYKSKDAYLEQPKDTTSEELKKITFNPEIKTFEMDIMDQMEIQENRIPYRSYWYV